MDDLRVVKPAEIQGVIYIDKLGMLLRLDLFFIFMQVSRKL